LQVAARSDRSDGDPLKALQLKRKGKSLRFAGKAIRVFEREALDGAQ